MDGQSTPLTQQDQLADELADMKSRIAELERALANNTVSPASLAALEARVDGYHP